MVAITGQEQKDMPLYKRQKGLGLDVPLTVGIIGAGGVGSWVMWGFGLSGTQKIIVVDHDDVSESNLNRTPFTQLHIGQKKVLAMTELLLERRDMKIVPIEKRIEDVPASVFADCELIVDCRDTVQPLPEELRDAVRIIGGYNGNSITIHLNPKVGSVWSTRESEGYTATPSSLLPTWGIAWIITTYILACPNKKKEIIKTFEVSELVEQLLKVKRRKKKGGK